MRSWVRAVRENPGFVFLVAVLMGSLSLNVVLTGRLRAVDRRDQGLRRAGLQERTTFPTIPALDPMGARVDVSFQGEQATILYILSPTCAWCQANQESIRRLAETVKGFRLVGLSTGSFENYQRYVRDGTTPFPVFLVDSKTIIKQLGLDMTPQTALIDTRAQVQKVWSGAFRGERRHEVEQFFNVTIPEATTPRSVAAAVR